MTRAPFTAGNARTDGARGWFIGQFVSPEGGLRRRGDVEVKWEVHPAGDRRAGWASNRRATTISILLAGRFRVRLRCGDEEEHVIELHQPGDYVIFAPGVEHAWEAPEDATMLTLRAPSLPDDQDQAR